MVIHRKESRSRQNGCGTLGKREYKEFFLSSTVSNVWDIHKFCLDRQTEIYNNNNKMLDKSVLMVMLLIGTNYVSSENGGYEPKNRLFSVASDEERYLILSLLCHYICKKGRHK